MAEFLLELLSEEIPARMQTRAVFEALFAQGYLVTDFLRAPGEPARSYYALSYGESTL